VRPATPADKAAAGAAPAATPPAQTGTIRVKDGAGNIREFDNADHAQRFIDLVEKAGGSAAVMQQMQQ
jgi:hypothetical protein